MNHSKPILNPLEALQGSLQAEFEHFAQYDWSADILAAKKRQLQLIKDAFKPIELQVNLAKRADKPSFKWIDGKPDGKFRLVSPSVFDGGKR